MESKNETEELILTGHSLERLNRRETVVIKIGKFQKPVMFDNIALPTHLRLPGTREDFPAFLYCKMRHEKKMSQSVFDHLTLLFRRSSPFIYVSFDSVDYFDKLIGMPGIAHTGIYEGTVDAKMLDKHFEKYPNQTSAYIDADIKGHFSENSAFINVPTIFSNSSSPISLLKLFNGRELRLYNYKFDTIDVIVFLDNWISGVSYRNLELLYLFSPVSLDKRVIIRFFELARWPEDTPYIFEFTTRMDRLKGKEKQVHDCRRCYRVVRDSDQKIAALEVKNNSIKLLVFQ